MSAATRRLQALGAVVLQRDWLSSNLLVFAASARAPATLIDSGYHRHQAMTLALVDHALGGQPLGRLLNTHLHADHCGGNQALQARYPGLQTWVPAPSLAAVQAWDEDALSYTLTGQTCPRFAASAGLSGGQSVWLADAEWTVFAAPGHDPDALMLFEPQSRCLIAGDALWEDRLAIIFPELDDRPGFASTRQTLDLVESLAPRCVVPGHGPVFDDVAGALAASRRRLDAFERDPARHHRHAARALLMFHMMEVERQRRADTLAWLLATPLFQGLASRLAPGRAASDWAADLVDELLSDGLLLEHDQALRVAASGSR